MPHIYIGLLATLGGLKPIPNHLHLLHGLVNQIRDKQSYLTNFKPPHRRKIPPTNKASNGGKIAEFIICDDSIDFGFDKEDAMADDYVQHKGSECNVFNVVSPYISSDEFGSGEDLFQVKVSEDKLSDGSAYAKDKKINAIDDFNEEPFVFGPKNESKKEEAYLSKRLLKGILKCPSVGQEAWNSLCPNLDCLLSVDNAKISLRRANSKGYNVSFGE
ncbi:putative trans-resveratrol di-O-methyltransferase-like isoform 1 [Capsicum annuum]|nr:putative trans-resveratrol di-O-methyltransferase-like isoform 1 [Capsicum annuum]